MIYLVVLAILIVGLFFDKSSNIRLQNKWLFLEWLSLVLLAGLRYKVGGDTIWYYEAYDKAPTLSQLSLSDITDNEYNILWILLTSSCKSLCSEFILFQIIHAIIVNTAFFTFFRRYVKRIFFAVLLYFVFYFFKYNTEILRASLSVSIFLFSFGFLEGKKWGKYILCSLLAIGFHSEAILMLLFPLVHLMKNVRVNLRFALTLIVFSLLIMSLDLIPALSNVLSFSQKMSSSLSYYADQTELGASITFLGYAKIFVTSSIWLVILYSLNGTQYGIFKGFAIIGFFVFWLSFNYATIFYRALDLIQPLFVTATCMSLEQLNIRKKWAGKVVIYTVLIIMLIDLFNYYLNGHFILFYPYSSYLDPVDYSEREFFFNSLFQH